MDALKDLIREIHRRSLWQVVLIYLVGSWIVLQIVGFLTGTGRVPEGTPTLAFVLLLVGLPVTLAAASVREGALGQDNALAGMIREIHRRSLWQVLGIFLAASWGALQVVEVLTETLALPDWTATMALVLLMVGLPVCLATAFVQEGLPGGERDGAGAESLDLPASEPSRTVRFLTWRNAILGGVGVFALLGISVAAYFIMWTAGIGPVGSLMAQGSISEGARVVLADFDDRTGEGLDVAVTEWLRADLSEASVLDLVDEVEFRPTLQLMRLEAGDELTAERALQVAQRQSLAAVIDGQVTSLGRGYLITATLRESGTGGSLASFKETAGGPDGLIDAIDRLSQDIREKSGESLRTIRAGKPLEQVTTSSLEALTLYSEAVESFAVGQGGPVREKLERAVALDSTFAMAWRMLFIASQDPTALVTAFRLRGRLPDLERYVVEGSYYNVILSDGRRTTEAYEAALRLDPEEARALNNLAAQYSGRQDWERAEELIRRGIASSGRAQVMYSVLVPMLLNQGRIDGAVEASMEFRESYPDSPPSSLGFAVLMAQEDLAGATDQARRRSEDVSQRLWYRASGMIDLALVALWTGRLGEARSLFLRAETLAAQENVGHLWEVRRLLAHAEALVGDPEWARSHIREGLEDALASLPANNRHRVPAADFLAASGDPEAAEAFIQDWRERADEEGFGRRSGRLERAALLARVERSDTVGARAEMDAFLLELGCRGTCWPFRRARFHERLGERARAAELYETVLRPGDGGWSRAPEAIAERLHAMLRLGPLYEELGDDAKAIEAYQRMVDHWADGDARAQETVRRSRERIAALGG